MIKRVSIYLTGMVFVSLGIVLCAKCGLGVSPVSSLPYVFEAVVPLTFGQLTIIYHIINIAIQLFLLKELYNIKVLLQIPVALIFGWLIDLIKSMIIFDSTKLLYQIPALILSVLFTALGMVCMVEMELVQNPPDGVVKLISEKGKAELGKVKVLYDVASAGSAALVGIVCLGEVRGIGIATLVSAVFVGRMVTFIKRSIVKLMKKKSIHLL